MPARGIAYHDVAAPACLDRAAQLLLESSAARLPDLSDVIVLLPHLYLARPLSEHLARLAARALLLPRFVTFTALAQSVRLDRPVLPRPRRQALIHDALRTTNWFRAGSLWRASDELLTLIDDLELHASGAHRAMHFALGGGRLLDMEAQLVARLSSALNGGDDALAPAAAYRAQLERVETRAPLFVIGIDRFNALEAQFLERYARSQPVHVVRANLRFGQSPRAAVIVSAWPELALEHERVDAPQTEPIATRARHLRAARTETPARGWITLFDAPALEGQAQAAVLQIQRWLAAGLSRIAIVAQDRFATRRVRALLERVGVLAKDEAGWRLSTTAASTVLMRWLDLLASEFGYRELLDFLSSPFVFAESEDYARRRVLADIDAVARKHNWARSLPHLRERMRAERPSVEANTALARIADSAQVFLGDAFAARVPGRNTLSRWIELLERSIHLLGVDATLAADAAGQQLLARLAERREQLGGEQSGRDGAAHAHGTRYSFAQWRDWLSHDLESAYFLDASVESPVVITQLDNMRLRSFDAIVVVGADEEHLFGAPPAGFFNERVRAQLGLPTHAERVRDQACALGQSMALAREVLFVWQSAADGAPRSASAFVERLLTLHECAYGGVTLRDEALQNLLQARQALAPQPLALDVPSVVAPAQSLPARLSVSAYQSLVGCPYQFFAGYVLKLKPEDDVREEMDKRDFGQFVHTVLHRFHEAHPLLQALPRATARSELLAIANTEVAHWQRRSALNRAWRLRWEGLVDEYLEWQAQREAQGWRWREGELARELPLTLSNAAALTLRGRIDRIDQRAGGTAPEVALIDYKTRAPAKLNAAQKRPGEDVQLPAYAALYGAAVAQAAYLSVDQDEVKEVALPDIAALADSNLQRLREVFDAMHAGAALRAQGVEDLCKHCDARGLCRRDVWA